MPRKKKEKYETCFSRLKLNNMGAVDGIISQTAKNSRNKVFTRKKRTNKALLNFFRGFQVKRKVRLML